MSITKKEPGPLWLLLVYTLPTKKAVERTVVWRKLQRFGTIMLHNAGYVLPNTPVNRERFEWSAKAIRDWKGEASVLEISAIDDLPPPVLREQFRQARASDYLTLIAELEKVKPSPKGIAPQLTRLRRRFEEIVAIDFFENPLRRKVEELLKRVEQPRLEAGKFKTETVSKADYQKRVWVTRPRPGIDRVSSAWLIARFIDPHATFTFGSAPKGHATAIPFDMFEGDGFGHEGDNCTFETLSLAFRVRDKKVQLIAPAIHDADLNDGKFGRLEGITLNQVLQGWAKQGIADEELLRRGMDLIEGL